MEAAIVHDHAGGRAALAPGSAPVALGGGEPLSSRAILGTLVDRHFRILRREAGVWPWGSAAAAAAGAALCLAALIAGPTSSDSVQMAGWAAIALGIGWSLAIPLALSDRRDGTWILEVVGGASRGLSFRARCVAGFLLYLWLVFCACSGAMTVALVRSLFVAHNPPGILSLIFFETSSILFLLPVGLIATAAVYSVTWRNGASSILFGVCLLEMCGLVLATLFAASATGDLPLASALFPVLGSFLGASEAMNDHVSLTYGSLCLCSGALYALLSVGRAGLSFADPESVFSGPVLTAVIERHAEGRDGKAPRAHVEHAVGALALIVVLALCAEPLLRGLSEASRVVVREIGLLLLPTLAVATLCRLPFRETFSLRPTRVQVWGGALLLAVGAHVLLREIADVIQRMVPPGPEAIARLQQQVEGVAVQQGTLGTLLVLALVPAIAEEFLFRGLLLRGLSRGFGIAGGVLASGILFGLVHGTTARVVPLSIFGILLGLVVVRSGSLIPAILAHAANNACVLGAMFLPSVRIWPWVAGEAPVPGEVLAGGAIVAIVGWLLIGHPAMVPATALPTEG